MGPVRFSINVTLDGCYDHTAMVADADLHRNATESLQRADALLFGRVTYQMMEEGWRSPDPALPEWTLPFARTISAAKKYVVSSTLEELDWNAEVVNGDLGEVVDRLRRAHPGGIFVGGAQLAQALTERRLIDEYEIVVHPRLAGHGPTLFAGLSSHVDLDLAERGELSSGAVVLRYTTRR
ncbi:dihydrofolate reductase family protein [Nocardioides caldifontis]|uniref:dihydrofolate reductase family protein n=1 Tax=Nocardioides caldifontis TaxID=2588938 RepID=UPI0011DF1388|nr:dihydrofolate reductase family protein [Nocardioides caldifontis]